MALTGPHHIRGMRLPVGDHPLVAASRHIGSETIGQGEQFGNVGRVSGERLPCRFGERPTQPGLIQFLEARFDLAATGQVETAAAGEGTDRRCCLMEFGEHPDDSSARSGIVVAIPTRLSIHEREQSDRVSRLRVDEPSRHCSRGSVRPRS